MEIDLTQDERDLIVVALERWLASVRREYEDALDVGENVSGLRARRDIIKALILKVGARS
jgi:hypothetical protein